MSSVMPYHQSRLQHKQTVCVGVVTNDKACACMSSLLGGLSASPENRVAMPPGHTSAVSVSIASVSDDQSDITFLVFQVS